MRWGFGWLGKMALNLVRQPRPDQPHLHADFILELPGAAKPSFANNFKKLVRNHNLG